MCQFFGAQAVHLAAGGQGTLVLAAEPEAAQTGSPTSPSGS